jgi:Fe2+ or Zn2+ uptake regulation protein
MKDAEKMRTPAEADTVLEAAVLRLLVALHPTQLTFDELVREMTGESTDFAETDAVQRAVRQLAAAGLAHRHGDAVLPSRAALRFAELFD